MEAFFFLIDIIAMVLLLYWSMENDPKGPDAGSDGLFAYRKTRHSTLVKAKPRAHRSVRRRSN